MGMISRTINRVFGARRDSCGLCLVIAFLLLFHICVLREVMQLRQKSKKQEKMVYLPKDTMWKVEQLLKGGDYKFQTIDDKPGKFGKSDKSGKSVGSMSTEISQEALERKEAKRSYSELERFTTMLKAWPPRKPKAAIYILVKSSRYSNTLADAFNRIDKYFNDYYHYPLVLFHETGFSDNDLASIRSWTRSDVYFQLVKFSVPKWLNQTKVSEAVAKAADKRYGYRHMCRFHSVQLQTTSIMKLLDYYWRLDDDSRLIGMVPFDLFKFMEKGSITYGYVHLSPENRDYVEGFYQRTNAYLTNKGIQPTFFKSLHRNRYFFNNFEISKLQFWRSKNVSEYLSAIDWSGGFYFHRWGDALVKTVTVSIFAPLNSVYQFVEVPYVHKNVNTTDQRFKYGYGRNLAQMVET